MKRLLLAALLAPLYGAAVAQTVETETLDNNTVNFVLEGKDRPGTLTLFLTLTDLVNCNASPGTTKYEVTHSHKQLLTLRPVDVEQGIGYRFAYSSVWGRINPPVDTTFVYRMPVAVRKPILVDRGYNVMQYGRARSEREQLCTYFETQKGDTIYAMRRGVVTEVEIIERDPDAPVVEFTTETSSVQVEHPDGSMGLYMPLDSKQIFIKLGDQVLPGTPLALAGSYDGERYAVGAMNFWWQEYREKDGRTALISRSFFPKFATDNGPMHLVHGIFTPSCDDALVMHEMSKKERKVWLGSKGK